MFLSTAQKMMATSAAFIFHINSLVKFRYFPSLIFHLHVVVYWNRDSLYLTDLLSNCWILPENWRHATLLHIIISMLRTISNNLTESLEELVNGERIDIRSTKQDYLGLCKSTEENYCNLISSESNKTFLVRKFNVYKIIMIIWRF